MTPTITQTTITKTAGRVTLTHIPCTIDEYGTAQYAPGAFPNVLDIILRSAMHSSQEHLTVSYEKEVQWQVPSTS